MGMQDAGVVLKGRTKGSQTLGTSNLLILIQMLYPLSYGR